MSDDWRERDVRNRAVRLVTSLSELREELTAIGRDTDGLDRQILSMQSSLLGLLAEVDTDGRLASWAAEWAEHVRRELQ